VTGETKYVEMGALGRREEEEGGGSMIYPCRTIKLQIKQHLIEDGFYSHGVLLQSFTQLYI
jgi:hypothetical protein